MSVSSQIQSSVILSQLQPKMNDRDDTFDENQQMQVQAKTRRQLRPSVGLSANARPTSFDDYLSSTSVRSHLNDADLADTRKAVGSDVALSIYETMKTLGLLAALLSSW